MKATALKLATFKEEKLHLQLAILKKQMFLFELSSPRLIYWNQIWTW